MKSFFDTPRKSEINPPAADRFFNPYSIIPFGVYRQSPPLWGEIKV
jgi:hypothetical protein